MNPDMMSALNQYIGAYTGTQGGAAGWSWANIIAWVLFGCIGFIAFSYGRKMENFRALIIGLILMIYPYFVSQTLLLYLVGIILCALLYFWRE